MNVYSGSTITALRRHITILSRRCMADMGVKRQAPCSHSASHPERYYFWVSRTRSVFSRWKLFPVRMRKQSKYLFPVSKPGLLPQSLNCNGFCHEKFKLASEWFPPLPDLLMQNQRHNCPAVQLHGIRFYLY
jgi:hypothetical protein